MKKRYKFSLHGMLRTIGASRASDSPTPGTVSRTAPRMRRWLVGFALVVLSAWQATAFASDPYAPDLDFPWQGFNPNAFGVSLTTANQSSAGKKIARLSDGTLVVASLVKKLDGSQTNGLWNVGITRYDPVTGLALAWPNRDAAYSGIKPWDVLYPNTATATFGWIQSVKVLNGYILVAVNNQFTANDVDTRVLVFGEDGSFKSYAAAFTSTANEYVGGMEAYQVVTSNGTQIIVSNVVIVVATKAGSPARPVFKRFELNASGILTDKTGVVALNTHYCGNTTIDCEPAGIALSDQILQSVAPSIYVLNRVIESNKKYFTVTRVSANGVASSSWTGYRIGSVNNKDLWAESIAVRSSFGQGDTVFVASELTRQCRNGIEVDRLTDSGVNNGWIDLGGSETSDPTICVAVGGSSSYPTALAISDNRLALAGFDVWQTGVIGTGEDDVDVALTIFDIGTGLKLQNKQLFPYEDDTARYAHSGAWGVIPTSNGRFVLAGDGRYPATATDGSAGKTFSFVLGVRPDRIFGDTFGLNENL